MKRKQSIPLIRTRFQKIGLTEASLGALADNQTIVDLEDDASEEDIQSALGTLEPFAKMLQKAEDGARQAYIDKQKEEAKKKAQSKSEEGGDPEPEPSKGSENPEIKALTEMVKNLTSVVTEMKGANTAKTRKELFRKELEGLPEAVINEKMADFDLYNFKDEEQFSTWLEGKKEGFEAIRQQAVAEQAGNFGQFQRSAGNGGNAEKPSAGMKAFLDGKAKKEGGITGKNLFPQDS